MKLAVLGLGKMGRRIAEKLLDEGHELVVWNRTQNVLDEFALLINEKQLGTHFVPVKSVEEAVKKLESPRIIWLMLPAGEATQMTIDEICNYLTPGDIVIDGANSLYTDTQRRSELLESKEIKFLGIGVSGGILAEKNGYPLMVGGNPEAYSFIEPILNSLSKPNGGHAYFGKGGAGHFVKMVHNGIEYGMMQAIGEGFGVLQKSNYEFDLVEVSKLWQKNTIVTGFLIDRARDALEKDNQLSDIVGEIAATGEAEWTINVAKEEQVPVPVIQESLTFRKKSLTDPTISGSFAAKMVAALRREFGGHAVKMVKKNG